MKTLKNHVPERTLVVYTPLARLILEALESTASGNRYPNCGICDSLSTKLPCKVKDLGQEVLDQLFIAYYSAHGTPSTGVSLKFPLVGIDTYTHEARNANVWANTDRLKLLNWCVMYLEQAVRVAEQYGYTFISFKYHRDIEWVGTGTNSLRFIVPQAVVAFFSMESQVGLSGKKTADTFNPPNP